LSAGDFFQDVCGFGGPDEGLWVVVVPIDGMHSGNPILPLSFDLC